MAPLAASRPFTYVYNGRQARAFRQLCVFVSLWCGAQHIVAHAHKDTNITKSPSASVALVTLNRDDQHRDIGRIDPGQPGSLAERGGTESQQGLAGFVA